MSMQSDFLRKIERFCRANGVAETTFGLDAVNDKSFVPDLRAGRNPSLRMVERVNEYMAERRKRSAA